MAKDHHQEWHGKEIQEMPMIVVSLVQSSKCLCIYISHSFSLASIPSWMIAGNRIQGGTDAQAPIPWQVAVRFNGNKYCGGTIIDAKTIVTAAHCINQQWTLHDVAAGSTNYNQFPQVSKKIIPMHIKKYD